MSTPAQEHGRGATVDPVVLIRHWHSIRGMRLQTATEAKLQLPLLGSVEMELQRAQAVAQGNALLHIRQALGEIAQRRGAIQELVARSGYAQAFAAASGGGGQGAASRCAASAASAAAAAADEHPMKRNPELRFNILRNLRETLMGSVAWGQDREFGERDVAIKMSNKNLMARGVTRGGAPCKENPAEERRILSLLSRNGGHPGLVGQLDVYENATHIWQIMEFCEGGELFGYIEHNGRMAEPRAKVLFRQIVQGLQYIHDMGFAHLDMSLENTLMKDDKAKICDFGLARELPPMNACYPASDDKPGKIAYMCPRIFAGQEFDGRLADVYSCGVMLFILLYGVPPYQMPSRNDGRFRLIHQGRMARLLEHWKLSHVASPQAVALVQSMLLAQENRPSLAEVLASPWLREDDGGHDNMCDDDDDGPS